MRYRTREFGLEGGGGRQGGEGTGEERDLRERRRRKKREQEGGEGRENGKLLLLLLFPITGNFMSYIPLSSSPPDMSSGFSFLFNRITFMFSISTHLPISRTK